MSRAIRSWVEDWWRGQGGLLGRALDLGLYPAELLFRGVVDLRGWAYDHGVFRSERVPIPVLSIGNIGVGGTGKTPVTRWLVSELRRRGLQPAILHGGYALDEPELHRLWHPEVPVLVGKDRRLTAQRGIESGAEVLVLDDGFQHRRLARDLDIVLIAAESWGRDIRLIPRGPWREPLGALARAGVIGVTRKTASREEAALVLDELIRYAPDAHQLQIEIAPSGWSPERPRGGVVAVTGIARPELFIENLHQLGIELIEALSYPDHHLYTESDLEEIERVARGRPIVTTAKDIVKFRDLESELEFFVLEQEIQIESGADSFRTLLDRLVGRGETIEGVDR